MTNYLYANSEDPDLTFKNLVPQSGLELHCLHCSVATFRNKAFPCFSVLNYLVSLETSFLLLEIYNLGIQDKEKGISLVMIVDISR